MNEVIRNIESRRSIRAYSPEQIEDEELKLILEAATYAPTGMGLQSPKIVVVQDSQTIKELSEMNAEVMGSSGDPFYGAPTVVVVLADSNRPTCVEDGSLVLGTMMLAASSIGVGSCWIHRAKEVFASEKGKEYLKKWGIPENYVGVGHCILGYPEKGAAGKAKPRKEDYIVRV